MRRQFASRYADFEEWHWWFRGRRRILAAVLGRQLDCSRSLRIASLGCGPASGLEWLRPFAGPAGCIVGLDLDPAHAARAPLVEYVVGRAEAAPLRAGAFDAVLLLDVLEHLDEDAAGLREAARLVAPRGLLLVTVPALPSLWGGQDEVSLHRRRYTRRTLRDAFARARLAEPDLTYFNALLLPPIAAIRWTRRALGLGRRPRADFDDNRPGPANESLAWIFACERHLVGRVPLPAGVSLLATLRIANRAVSQAAEHASERGRAP